MPFLPCSGNPAGKKAVCKRGWRAPRNQSPLNKHDQCLYDFTDTWSRHPRLKTSHCPLTFLKAWPAILDCTPSTELYIHIYSFGRWFLLCWTPHWNRSPRCQPGTQNPRDDSGTWKQRGNIGTQNPSTDSLLDLNIPKLMPTLARTKEETEIKEQNTHPTKDKCRNQHLDV